jgi:rsbT co-antagonist protein RsbR
MSNKLPFPTFLDKSGYDEEDAGMSKPTATTESLSADELIQLRQRVRELEQALAESKRNEQSLTQRITVLQEHAHLLDVTQDALLVRDLEGTILFWNQTAARIYGWSNAEAIGSIAHTLLQTQFPLPLTAIKDQLLQRGSWEGELTQINRDGTALVVHSRWQLQQDRWSKSAVVFEAHHDITERKHTELELRASEVQLRALFAAISDVIMVIDREGIYRKIAPTNPRLLYRLPDETVGKRLHEVLPPAQADFFLTIVRRALEARQVIHTEYPLQIADQEFWFSGAVSPLDEDMVIWVGRDITERKRTDQEQVRLREQIIRAQAEMLAELSTPLIALNDQVLVMPIIGVMDQQRAQGLLTTLLEGIKNQRAAVVIIDITGVPRLDTQVVYILIHAGQSVQLLGTQVVLTGMRADMVQELVTMGIDLGEIVTRSTLQSGISYALEQAARHPRH